MIIVKDTRILPLVLISGMFFSSDEVSMRLDVVHCFRGLLAGFVNDLDLVIHIYLMIENGALKIQGIFL